MCSVLRLHVLKKGRSTVYMPVSIDDGHDSEVLIIKKIELQLKEFYNTGMDKSYVFKRISQIESK